MNVEMFADYVLVQRRELQELRTPGGLILVKGSQEVPMDCTVIAVGPGRKDQPMPIKVGDTVLVSKYAGVAWDVDATKEKFIIVRMDDIVARLPDGAPTVVDKTENKI